MTLHISKLDNRTWLKFRIIVVLIKSCYTAKFEASPFIFFFWDRVFQYLSFFNFLSLHWLNYLLLIHIVKYLACVFRVINNVFIYIIMKLPDTELNMDVKSAHSFSNPTILWEVMPRRGGNKKAPCIFIVFDSILQFSIRTGAGINWIWLVNWGIYVSWHTPGQIRSIESLYPYCCYKLLFFIIIYFMSLIPVM